MTDLIEVGRIEAGRRVLILAPHPDDEIVACAIAAGRAKAAGAEIFVLYLTSGVPAPELLWPWQRAAYPVRLRRRREEAAAAADLLGLRPIGFLDGPARGLRHRLVAARREIERVLGEHAADCLWVTAFEGAHQDHDAANALAASFRGHLPIWEFAAYNFAGGRVQANRFADRRDGDVAIAATPGEMALKRAALACYRSERGNLGHIGVADEAARPLPAHDYGAPPHPGRLFRERFHWVPFRHPRVDFTPSAEIYAGLGAWAEASVPQGPGLTLVVPAVRDDGRRANGGPA